MLQLLLYYEKRGENLKSSFKKVMERVKKESALRSLWRSFTQADPVNEIDNNSENLEMAAINNDITLSEEDKKLLFRALKDVEKNEIRQPLKVKIEKEVRRKQRESQNTVPRYQAKVQEVNYRNNEKEKDDENERI